MESFREAKRIIENEIAKGSCPLRFQGIDMNGAEYRSIDSRDRLMDVLHYLLRISKFSQYANKSTQNNIYTDFADILLRKMKPRRTRNIVERNEIFIKISRYGGKVKPDYDGKIMIETVPCYFNIPEEELEKWKYTFEGKETYAFMLHSKHISNLCICVLQNRMEAAKTYVITDDTDDIRVGVITMDGVRTCLFQALMMDDMQIVDGKVMVKLYTIHLLK